IIDFVYPNYLGKLDSFENSFSNDIDSAARLEPQISPLILRRTILDVAQDLPEKIIIPQAIDFDESLYDIYESIRSFAINETHNFATFANITKLRMLCCDPSLIKEFEFNDLKNNK